LVQADIEKLGLGPFMLKYGARSKLYFHNGHMHLTTAVDSVGSKYGELWRVAIPYDEDVVAVLVHDPYGERKEYWLRVPPMMYSAHEAVAWTFDVPTSQYDPIKET
jgi:hypothetical protein